MSDQIGVRFSSLARMALLALPALVGCGGQVAGSGAFSQDEAFVPVRRSAAAAQAASVHALSVPATDASQSFYLAINKRELGQRWFLSAYLKNFLPGEAAIDGAANSLGVRVVTFRVQNDKLFVFDASDNYAGSDSFDPELLIEAYPIVDSAPGFSGAGTQNYVLFDPAAGLNRFGVVSDAYAAGSTPVHFKVDLAFMQNFRKLADGVTFEQVFTGYSNDIAINGGPLANEFQGSGTLGLALRRYSESPGYSPTPVATLFPGGDMYFRSASHVVKNGGYSTQTSVKWDIHKGMKPIVWLVSNQLQDLAKDPVYGAYDILGAVKRGIENWNDVFGFPALQAQVALPGDSFADDDKNYIIYDANPTSGYAYANERSNPNTGELRGATVYFDSAWLQAVSQFSDDAPSTSGATQRQLPVPSRPAPITALTWNNMSTVPLCVLTAPTTNATGLHAPVPAAAGAVVAPSRTQKQKFEAFITHVINHEIGHTLGLRHNFKGSLAPPSSSVMDYVFNDDASLLDKPQPYDVAAVQFLYGLSPDLPTQLFCTDEDTLTDPDCSRFDYGAHPLDDFAGWGHTIYMQYYLNGRFPVLPDYTLNLVLKWLKGGTPAQHLTAWSYVIANLQIGVDYAGLGFNPASVDTAAGWLFSRMYLDTPDQRADPNNGGVFLQDVPVDTVVTPLLITQLQGNLTNADHIRSYATRRVTVAVLKKLQTTAALQALIDARATIVAARAGLTGSDATLTDELLSRIDSATSSYFNK